MRNYLIVFLLAMAFYACEQAQSNPAGENETNKKEQKGYHGKTYGKKVTAAGAISGKDLKEQMGKSTEYEAKVKGEIVKVCQKEGCWLRLDMGDGTNMQVNMKGHSFFVPKDLAGEVAIVEGRAYTDTISVDKLRHYAEDEGKSAEEIASINDPEVNIVFDAEGVLIE
ncbi:MAG: DUF4920 domain-containing protein [Bacteroidota bacterium]|nr:DUF4920 domain-containing protein [Bacteroidota bacterium]